MSTEANDDFFSKLLKHIEKPEFGYNGIMHTLKKEEFFTNHPELNLFTHLFNMKAFNESSNSGLLLGTDEKIYNFPYLLKEFIVKMKGTMSLSQMTEFYNKYESIRKVVEEKGALNLIKKFGMEFGFFVENEFIQDRNFKEDLKNALIDFVRLHNGEVSCCFLPDFYQKNPTFSKYVKQIGIKKLVNFGLVWPENHPKILWSGGCLKLVSSVLSNNTKELSQSHENSINPLTNKQKDQINQIKESEQDLYSLLLKFVKENNRKINCNFLAFFYKDYPKHAESLKQIGIKKFLQSKITDNIDATNPVLIWNQGYLEIKHEASIIEKPTQNQITQPKFGLKPTDKKQIIKLKDLINPKNLVMTTDKKKENDKNLYSLLIEFVKDKNLKINCSHLPEFYKKYPKESETLKRQGIKKFLQSLSIDNTSATTHPFLFLSKDGYLELKNFAISQQNNINPQSQFVQNSNPIKKYSKWRPKMKKNWHFYDPSKQRIHAPKQIFENNILKRAIVKLEPYFIPKDYLVEFSRYEKINVLALEISLKNILASNENGKSYLKDAENYSLIDLNNLGGFFYFSEMLMYVEEVKIMVEMCNYDLDGANFRRIKSSDNLYELNMPGLAERRPSIMCGDKVILESTSYKIFGSIWKVKENSVLVSFPENMIDLSYKFDVHFEFNRSTLKLMHRALEKWSQLKLLHQFFDNWTLPSIPEYPLTYLSRELNEMQSKVVQALIKSCETPFQQPLIIFGPPGTGKTATIVEGVIQILKNKPVSKILVCTPSNSSADLICERLIDAFEMKGNKKEFANFNRPKIIRINAASRNQDSVSKKIKDNCKTYFIVPSNEVIKSGDVIVTTGSSAGYLVSLRLQIFSHIFFDEAGESLVGDTLIPFSLKNEDTTIIIAGDPKQLGPIIISPLCLTYGMDISLLERLFNLKLKQLKNENPTVEELLKVGVFHLIDNYRAHEGIVKIYNDQFYNSKLQPKGDQTLIKWKGLKNPNIPLLFKNIVGQEEREEDSPSWFNQTEIEEIFKILNDMRRENLLINKNVGIISPYRKQCAKIRERLKAEGFLNVDVGTTEFFQGDERNVIIVTCVRSIITNVQADLKFHLGFISKPKRINVSISRAKNLLVILGNAELLYTDPMFKKILEQISELGCYEGPDFKSFKTDPPLEALTGNVDAIGTENFEEIKRN